MCSSYGDVILKKHDREKEREREKVVEFVLSMCIYIVS